MRLTRPRTRAVSTGVFVALLLTLLAAGPLVALPKADRVDTETQAFTGWELTGGTVVEPGITGSMAEGTLSTGYVVEAKARAPKGSSLPSGTFRISLSAFSPKEDMPRQLAGMWYVKGEWQIEAAGASKEETKTRHNKYTMSGTLLAELPFNPVTDEGIMAAAVNLPMSPDGGQWSRGDLVFSGNHLFEGTLMGTLEQWPAETSLGAEEVR